MKKSFFLTAMFSLFSLAYADDKFSVSDGSITATIDGKTAICRLDSPSSYAVESWDGSALIVSGRGYVAIADVMSCERGKILHVSEIPDKVGTLSDINLTKGIYVALDFVTVSPFAYLATVAKIGNTKNLVNLSGAYVRGEGMKALRGAAFASSGGAGASSISPDGRFVAPNGSVDCSKEGYPGVWDINNDKRVFLDSAACNRLFQ